SSEKVTVFARKGSVTVTRTDKNSREITSERTGASGSQGAGSFNSKTLAAKGIYKPVRGPAIAAAFDANKATVSAAVATSTVAAAVKLDPQGVHIGVKTPISMLNGTVTLPYKVVGDVIKAATRK
ncbi:MAG: hypothetical protein ACRYGK_09535, partial [Janthinobacterium lividum]